MSEQEGSPTPSRSRSRGLLVAGTILVLGVAISVAGALLWHSSVRERERESFQTNATDVSATLQDDVRRDTDFVSSLRAVVTVQPDLTPTGYGEWLSELEGSRRQLGGAGALVVRAVPAARLTAFEAMRDADPGFRRLVGGYVEPVARTSRPFYCLLAGGSADITYAPGVAAMLQGDWCNPSSLIGGFAQNGTTRWQFTEALTNSGQFGVYTVDLGGLKSLLVESAFYRRGAPLGTVAERRGAVLGWVLGSFEIPALLRSAMGHHRGLDVTLYHSNPGLRDEFIGSIGRTRSAPFSEQTTLQADGTWTVRVTGSALAGGPSAQLQALVVLFGGILVSVLLAALVLVLTRSRERALAMVEEKTRQLRHQAMHDALTGLPNRVLALDRAEQMLARARRSDRPVAALYVDVDGFKEVNDRFGHAAGDELLQLVAERLAKVVRDTDTAARLAGDEFLVLVEGATLAAGPELVAERLLEVLRRPYELGGDVDRTLPLSASIGIAFGLRESAEALLRDADLALYEAKAAGRDRFVLFEPAMQTASQDRLSLQLDLADALHDGELFLLYRATLDLRTGAPVGAEALVRWRHPQRGVLAAEEFMPIAEESGMSVSIGRWMIEEACRQAARWREQGTPRGVSVDVSARQLGDEGLVADVAAALDATGLPAASLTLEVSEATLMRDPEGTAARLTLLRRLGVRVAIDDFAARYGALAVPGGLAADALKVDGGLVREVAQTGRRREVLRTLVELGEVLRLQTLAEGFEEPQATTPAAETALP